MRTPILAAATAILLSACAADGAGVGVDTGTAVSAGAGFGAGVSNDGMPLNNFFQCEGGKAFAAQYFGRERVVVTTRDQARLELNRVPGAPGHTYANGQVRFSTDLTTATLSGTPLDPFTGCRTQS